MRPTPFAEQIYLPIKNALLALQGISVLQYQNFDAGMVHNLKIAIHDEIEPLIFPKLIHHFQKLNSDIEFLSSKLDRKMIISDLKLHNKLILSLISNRILDKNFAIKGWLKTAL